MNRSIKLLITSCAVFCTIQIAHAQSGSSFQSSLTNISNNLAPGPPEFVFVDEFSGPVHRSFSDRGFVEVGYNDEGVSFISPDAEQFLIDQGFSDPDGFLPDGVHVFYNYDTGEVGAIVPPGFTASGVVSAVTVLEAAIAAPVPQQSYQRSSSTLRSRGSNRMIGINAGEEYVMPDGSKSALSAEYSYVDIGVDNPLGGALAGETNVYSVSYEALIADNWFLDLGYEYADERLIVPTGGTNDIDTHTIAGAISTSLFGNVYGMFILGGSFSDGGTNVAGAQIAAASGETLFLNPGVGSTWAYGNFVFDAAASYLYQDTDTSAGFVNGVPVASTVTAEQIILEAGARYNFTESLYGRAGVQYNNIVDDSFGAGVTLDEQWVQVNSEIGVTLDNGVGIYFGYAYEASHSIYDTHIYRAGISYAF